MSETGNQDPRDEWEYFRGLSLEEVQQRLEGLRATVEGVKSHYSGPIGSLRRKIKNEDFVELVGAISDLLPMSANTAVQQEILAEGAPEKPEDLTLNRISALNQDVLTFASRFDNSGVTLLPLSSDRSGELLR